MTPNLGLSYFEREARNYSAGEKKYVLMLRLLFLYLDDLDDLEGDELR